MRPFERATRQNVRYLEGKSLPTGAGVTEFTLPQVGLLSALHLEVVGAVTLIDASGNPTVAPLGPWGHLSRIRVTANNGIDIVDVSGWGLYLENLTRQFSSVFDTASALDDSYKVDVTASAGGTSATVKYGLRIPISSDDRDLLGLILLQSPELVVTVRIDSLDPTTTAVIWAKTATPTVISAPVFTAHLSMEYFSVPSDPAAYPPVDMVCRTIEQTKDYSTTGMQTLDLPRGNIYAKLINAYLYNGVTPSGSYLDQIELRYNQSETPYLWRPNVVRRIMRDQYGRIFPAGVFVSDWNHQGVPTLGTARDYIDSEKITDFQLRTNLTGSFTTIRHIAIRTEIVELKG